MRRAVCGLPSVDELLDRGQLRELVSQRIGDAGRDLESVEPFYLRYKTDRSIRLGLSLRWHPGDGPAHSLGCLYLGADARTAREKTMTLRLLEPPRGPATAGTGDSLWVAFPNDRELRGLSAAADIRRLGNRLKSATGLLAPDERVRTRHSAVEVIRWKPGRRAVLRARLELKTQSGGGRRHVVLWVRVVPRPDLPRLSARWRAAADRNDLRTPSLLTTDPERGLLVVSDAPGGPFLEHAFSGSHAWSALSRHLRALRQMRPTGRPADHRDAAVLRAAERTLGAVASLAPELSERAREIGSSLAEALRRLPASDALGVHGDLTADQVLVDDVGVVLLDWDEFGVGDPHADLATLWADLHVRLAPEAAARVRDLACDSLGAGFDERRFAWQRAAAACRRALDGLQRGRIGWREEARVLLESAAAVLDRSKRSAGTRHGSRTGACDARSSLARLLDPESRGRSPECADGHWSVTAVWPKGETAAVRLERPAPAGASLRWVRIDGDVEVFDSPRDPVLADLERLVASGRFRIAGHRLGRRAALREAATGRFLFLRPAGSVDRMYQTLSQAHLRLRRAQVPHAELLGRCESHPGWWMAGAAGRPVDAAHSREDVWERLGADLARVHCQAHAEEVEVDPVARAIEAARRQIAVALRPEPRFAQWLMERIPEPQDARPGTRVWIHGDLHPGQLIVDGGDVVIIDWERARLGEAEEDLANLAAHLAWEADSEGARLWRAVRRGYSAAGGRYRQSRLTTHLRIALVRVLAVHSWRDSALARATDMPRWDDFLREAGSW